VSDVVATVWGLMTFAGFVVSLQIGKADEFAQNFDQEITDASWLRARRWALFVRSAPILVTVVVVAIVTSYWLTQHGGADALTKLPFWLLTLPILVQLLFALVVLGLVHPIPPIRYLAPSPLGPGLDRSSPDGPNKRILVRFRNLTSEPLLVCWVDFQGNLDEAEREWPIAVQSDRLIDTYETHRWMVRTVDGRDVALFAAAFGIADIVEAMLPGQ
jgi:hypothetical protein